MSEITEEKAKKDYENIELIKHMCDYIKKHATYVEFNGGDCIIECNGGDMIFGITAIKKMEKKE